MELFARERSAHSRSKEKNLAFAFWLRSLGTSHWAKNYPNFLIMPNQCKILPLKSNKPENPFQSYDGAKKAYKIKVLSKMISL